MPSRPDSFYYRLPDEERRTFVEQLLDGSKSHKWVADYWKEKGYPISHVSIFKYRRKPEFAEALNKSLRAKAFSTEVEKAAARTVAPKIKRLTEMAEETYDLAKMEPKRAYKAMTDAMGVLLGVVQLEAEINGEKGQAQAPQKQQNITIDQMIVLPRNGPVQGVLGGGEDAIDIEGLEVPLQEDMRLLEEDDEDPDS